MAIVEVLARFDHVCDACERCTSRTTRERPPGWSLMTIARDALDFSGVAVADASISLLFCGDCASAVVETINTVMKSRESLRSGLANPSISET